MSVYGQSEDAKENTCSCFGLNSYTTFIAFISKFGACKTVLKMSLLYYVVRLVDLCIA